MQFSEKIKEFRKQKGLTQEQLAERSFVSRSVIAKFETGRAYPSGDVITNIAIALNVSIDDLISSSENKEITLNTSNVINNIRKSLLIIECASCFALFLLLVLPIFKYGHYLYPIPEGQIQPEYVYGQISLVTATTRGNNPIGIISLVLLIITLVFSVLSLFVEDGKKIKTIRIINIVGFCLVIIGCVLTMAWGISIMNSSDFAMNSKG